MLQNLVIFVVIGVAYCQDFDSSIDLTPLARAFKEYDINVERLEFDAVPEQNTCHECLINVGEYIIDEAMKSWQNACEMPLCDDMKTTCEEALKEEKFMKGVMIDRTKAMKVAGKYCQKSLDCPEYEDDVKEAEKMEKSIAELGENVVFAEMDCEVVESPKGVCPYIASIECVELFVMAKAHAYLQEICKDDADWERLICHYLYMDEVIGAGWLASHVAPHQQGINYLARQKKGLQYHCCMDGGCDCYDNEKSESDSSKVNGDHIDSKHEETQSSSENEVHLDDENSESHDASAVDHSGDEEDILHTDDNDGSSNGVVERDSTHNSNDEL
eukprot:GHVL01024842.1.p1 GENE.GHVL01024842.1~~GHVL01024842.1.p1  ORF type:complete len:341 (+),score=67.38 GHVL01024842.1:34-1023(+)